jgi:hypothetical protein
LPFPVEREFGTVKFGKRTPSTESPVKRSKAMVEQLKSAQIFKDYQEAFRETTGMPLNLRAVEGFDLPHRDDPRENPFCALMVVGLPKLDHLNS